MNQDNLVTVITATIGREHLARCIESVQRQTHPNIQHLVVVDGAEHHAKAKKILKAFPKVDVIYLPYSTKQWGGRVYAAAPHVSRGDFVINLDDDNTMEPDHVASMLNAIGDHQWCYSLRRLMRNGTIVGQDDCESLGPLHPHWSAMRADAKDYHIDTNCFLLRRPVALECSPYWAAPKFTDNVYGNDRIFYRELVRRYPKCVCSLRYTLNYEVAPEKMKFFEAGNQFMLEHYNGTPPWRSRKLMEAYLRHGIWTVEDAKQNLQFDESLASEIVKALPGRRIADVGCGFGAYAAHFAKAGAIVQGYDGMTAGPNALHDRITVVDLARSQVALPLFDVVVSLEVGQYIPKEYEQTYLNNLVAMSSRWLVVSWAQPQQCGPAHFNERSPEWVTEQLVAKGFRHDAGLTDRLRQSATLPHFQKALLVLERV